MNNHAPDCGEAGFTLLETIIAFMILALSLAVTVEAISQGAFTFRRAGDLERASLVMQALASGKVRQLNGPGRTSGSIDGAEWEINATGFSDRYPGDLLAVDIRIRPRGADGPVFEYATLATPGRTDG